MATSNISNLSHPTSVTAPWHTPDRLLQAIGDFVSLPALPLHIHYTVLSTIFYCISYRYILPRLSSRLSPKRYSNLSARLKLDWDLCAISMLQSLLNSSMAICLCLSDSPLHTMTWKERIWGYESRTGAVLGAAIGYFIFHLGEAIIHMHLQGPIFVFHGAACVVLCGVAFVCGFILSTVRYLLIMPAPLWNVLHACLSPYGNPQHFLEYPEVSRQERLERFSGAALESIPPSSNIFHLSSRARNLFSRLIVLGHNSCSFGLRSEDFGRIPVGISCRTIR